MDTAYTTMAMDRIKHKTKSMLEQIGDRSPHVARADGGYDDLPHWWWTSGFWPGILWLMHDITGSDEYRQAAWDWDSKIEQCFSQYPLELHHDVGFQFLPTAVIKHQITGDQEALRIGLRAADFLAGRFNPAGGFIRAWNGDHIGWAIIDCMMNLPLLFWASRESGDPRYKHIAVRHADTILKNAVREDGSVAHILSFDPETGEFIEQLGGQGYASDSAWSRGNAWALYGFAIAYRNTGDQRYLDASKRIAHHFIAALPDDAVPHWDFRVEHPEEEERDSSAGAIAASGLIEIAEHVPYAQKRIYRSAAERILHSLTEHYATWDQPEHQAILLEGTGHKPAGENINVSLIYGDYYYIEAMAKLNGWTRRIF